MVEEITQGEPEHRTLHDRLFKEFFTRFLEEFMWIFFPEQAEHLDFSTLHFSEKELVINLPNQTLRITDVVAEVKMWKGEPETLIIHIEAEARDQYTLPQRVSEYYALLRVLKRLPVLPIAFVLLPGVGGLKWQTYTEQIFGKELLRFQYGQVGVRDLVSEQYLAENSPVAARCRC